MKKFLIGAVGVVAMATSASAADLAARPYTKAPAMVAAVYDWSGFYIGANGGWGSSSKCWDITQYGDAPVIRTLPRVAMTRPVVSRAARSVIAGRLHPGYSAWKHRATGQTSVAAIPATSWAAPSNNRSKIDAFGLFTGQVGYRLEQRPALRQGRRCGHQRQVHRLCRQCRRAAFDLRIRQLRPEPP